MTLARSTHAVGEDIAARYARDGFAFPIDVMTRREAEDHRARLETLEQRAAGTALGNKSQLNHPHVIFTFAHRIVTHPAILDAVEAVLGPDILVWGATFFIKEPRTERYVSWHQDLRYWGFDGDEEASAWLALSPVTVESGCMRFVPGSHLGELVPHNDTFDGDNVLTRGQEAAVRVDEAETVPVELAPGQVSLHHGRLLHASGPNRSDGRRIGLTINYITPRMRQVVATEDFAMLVRGEDRHGHFVQVPPPAADLDEDAMAWHARIMSAQNQAFYEGAEDAPR